MPEYLITWNIGYGESHEVIEAESQEQANKYAYESWREEAENNADYEARAVTDELKEEYGLD